MKKEKKQSPPGSEHRMENYPDHGEYTYKGHALFAGKTVLVTGGDSGIGKAISIAFAREGANVVLVYLSEEEQEDAKDTLQWIEQAGVKGLAIQADIKQADNCKKIVATTVEIFGQIDVLINNAAFQKEHKAFVAITEEDLKMTYETNVYALFYMTKYSLDHIPKGGSIIHTTSVNVYDPNPDLLMYASSKAAIQNLTASMSKMFLEQGKGIRVNAVAPGPVWTPLIPTTLSDIDTFGQNTPLKRPAQPSEIAPAYIFLASEAASYISGTIISATGGRITL
ncbi:SDR family oxidoreductase [Myroides sp. DW712]|uniref:SDR family oxidoreductase n=1 Tax=Myroides sp. DW712 TaxID=3389800 RepID=UPI00397D2908